VRSAGDPAKVSRRWNWSSDKPGAVHLVGAILLEQNDEWAVQRRYPSLETLGAVSDNAPFSLSAIAA
jgi:hypothetical protein